MWSIGCFWISNKKKRKNEFWSFVQLTCKMILMLYDVWIHDVCLIVFLQSFLLRFLSFYFPPSASCRDKVTISTKFCKCHASLKWLPKFKTLCSGSRILCKLLTHPRKVLDATRVWQNCLEHSQGEILLDMLHWTPNLLFMLHFKFVRKLCL